MSWGWAFDGVNKTIERTAGPECAHFLSWQRQLIECVILSSLSAFLIHYVWSRLDPCVDPNEEQRLFLEQQQRGRSSGRYFPRVIPQNEKADILLFNDVSVPDDDVCKAGNPKDVSCRVHYDNHLVHGTYDRQSANAIIPGANPSVQLSAAGDSEKTKHGNAAAAVAGGSSSGHSVIISCDNVFVGKQVLLVLMTFVLGLELGFKFSSRTVIFLLNPCHITTIMQIYVLAARPGKFATAIFRIQMNYLNGPVLAFLFPETESRRIPMEALLYWIQHGLMFINTIYLLRLKHPETGIRQYSVEPLSDWTWNVFSYACLTIYHFAFLVILAIPTEVNLNHMLCPALLDPFSGPNYRIIAIVHQGILCPLMCKTFCWAFSPNLGSDQRKKKWDDDSLGSASSVPLLSSSGDSPGSTGATSPGSSEPSSPLMEHPIQSLNRAEYLNLINDSDGDEATQHFLSYEGSGLHSSMVSSTPVKRGAGNSSQSEEIVFNASAMEKSLAEFLDKKQE